MKKRNLIMAICLCLSSYCWAERTTLKELTENWLKRSSTESNSERPEILDDGEDPVTPQEPGPVGDSIWLLVGMGAIYALAIVNREKNHCLSKKFLFTIKNIVS